MGDFQLKWFENFPGKDIVNAALYGNASLMIHAVYIPGSISFSNLNMMLAASGTTAKTVTVSFGLYSLNGATLSLANSASATLGPNANTTAWLAFTTSATQNITPGIWYFGVISSTSSNSRLSLYVNRALDFVNGTITYAGPFFRGIYGTSTGALPASIATSDMKKEGNYSTTAEVRHPYILISA